MERKALEPKATIPKTSPEETPIWIKERVITKRKKTKLCALKLHWRLAKEGLRGSGTNNWQDPQTRGLDSQIQSQER